MSKLNAIRLINLNYNHNSIHISDEVMHLNGESTLLSLDNGGGKSVLVQMLTAPFVHKRYRNTKDRPFASYFTSSRPSLILLEWSLEGAAGYLLTGMCVRKNQSSESMEELDIVNIIGEYQGPCPYDLHHLEVVERNSREVMLKSYAACRQLFEELKREYSGSFFHYDMNNSVQAKQYFEKLMEYGINYREWQSIIKKINEEESGLSKLFSEAQDEKGLVEKWFLASVEQKLNKEQNRMERFRTITEKYITSFHDNQDKLQRRDTLKVFEQEAERIEEQTLAYYNSYETSRRCRQSLAAYHQELELLLENNHRQLLAAEDELHKAAASLVQLDYEEYSAAYYGEQSALEGIAEQLESLASKQALLQEARKQNERDLHILHCAKARATVDEEQADVSLVQQRLEVARHRQADLQPEREYLGYVLKLHYQEQLQLVKLAVQSLKDAAALTKERERLLKQDILNVEKEQSNTVSALGAMQQAIAAYDRDEQRYNRRWKASLKRNLLGLYEEGALEALTREAEQQEDATIKTKIRLQGNIVKQREGLEVLEHQLADWQKQSLIAEAEKKDKLEKKTAYEQELEERRLFMRYLELGAERVFDKAYVLKAAELKLVELGNSITRTLKELSDLQEEQQKLKTGKVLKLPPELEAMFEQEGFQLVYGMQWLKQNGHSEAENLTLVKQHPFLPYALIMTRAELTRLAKLEKKLYTSFPVPIIARESLAADADQAGESLPFYGEVSFYLLFNNNLLNEAKLSQLLNNIAKQVERKESDLDTRRSERDHYLTKKAEVEKQSVTKDAYELVTQELDELDEKCHELQESIIKGKANQKKAKEEYEKLQKDLQVLEKSLDKLKDQRENLEELEAAYIKYKRNLQEQYELEKRLKRYSNKLIKYKNELDRYQEEALEGTKQLVLKEQEVQAKEQELAKYSSFVEVTKPGQVSDALLAKLELVKARYQAITENISQELQSLEQAIQQANLRLGKAKRELQHLAKKYGLETADWQEANYTIAMEDELEAELKQIETAAKANNIEINQQSIAQAKHQEKQRGFVERIRVDCHQEEPLAKANIVVVDFAVEKSKLVQNQQRIQNKYEELDRYRQSLEQNLTAVLEYKIDKRLVWKEESLTGLTGTELREFTAKLQRAYRDAEAECRRAQNKVRQRLDKATKNENLQESYCKQPLEMLLEQIEDPKGILEQLNATRTAFTNLMAKLLADIAIVEKEKEEIVSALESYAHSVHEELGKIDRNSSIQIREKSVKMLKIKLVDWESNSALYHLRISDMLEDITKKGSNLLDKGLPVNELVGKRLTTRELYEAVIGLSNVHIQLYKIEAQRELPITWNEVARNSGGEGFLSAFVILASLLYYMRRDDTDIFADHNEGKVLIMDNPFAQTNAAHLLKPLMEVAKKNNTQMICLTGLKGDSIYNRFDNIYVLNLISSKLSGDQYLKSKHLLGVDQEVLDFSRVEVKNADAVMDSLF